MAVNDEDPVVKRAREWALAQNELADFHIKSGPPDSWTQQQHHYFRLYKDNERKAREAYERALEKDKRAAKSTTKKKGASTEAPFPFHRLLFRLPRPGRRWLRSMKESLAISSASVQGLKPSP